MRRLISVPLLVLGVATLLVLDTAEARGRRRCRPQCVVCCEKYVVTTTVCPQYKMMSMGSLYHYYAWHYPNGCSGSTTPVAYDTTNSISAPCLCGGVNSCCIPYNYIWGDSLGEGIIAPGKKQRDIKKDHAVKKDIKPSDPMDKHYEWDSKTSCDKQFIVQIGDDSSSATWWAKVGRFTYTPGDGSEAMTIFVGYEVKKPSGSSEVTVDVKAVTDIDDLLYVKMLNVSVQNGSTFDGHYQVVRAH